MEAIRRQKYSVCWEETECLTYYGMLSLHEIFEIVGTQLTEMDVEVLSFLLEETYNGRHPLDPAGWTPDVSIENLAPGDVAPTSPRLLEAWVRLQPRSSTCPTEARHKPKSGVELLLELERRGYLSEGNLEPLLQLLRILTRHDLLPFVSRKKRRTVSPDCRSAEYLCEDRREVGSAGHTDNYDQTNSSQDCLPQQWRAGVDPSRQTPTSTRRKRGRGRRRSKVASGPTRRRAVELQEAPTKLQPPQEKITCELPMSL